MSMVCRLSNPTATLSGVDQNGTSHSVLLTLSAPKAAPADKVCLVLSTGIMTFIPLRLCFGAATIQYPSVMLRNWASALDKVDDQLCALQLFHETQLRSKLLSLPDPASQQ